ncbi:hypothetical protein WH47_00644 [Habropoda laboriosa]|uniref:Uncharacterized protein n=1 Tax=Habropoda laboriosa TaxID=597456 RepID=A0A0L7RI49_9HYME|nr:hypothetical protein WH47_00644 [Habropoda laboriosa]
MEDYGQAKLLLADRWSNRIDYLFIKNNIKGLYLTRDPRDEMQLQNFFSFPF